MRDLLDQREESLLRLQQLQTQMSTQRNSVESPSALDSSAPWNAKWKPQSR